MTRPRRRGTVKVTVFASSPERAALIAQQAAQVDPHAAVHIAGTRPLLTDEQAAQLVAQLLNATCGRTLTPGEPTRDGDTVTFVGPPVTVGMGWHAPFHTVPPPDSSWPGTERIGGRRELRPGEERVTHRVWRFERVERYLDQGRDGHGIAATWRLRRAGGRRLNG